MATTTTNKNFCGCLLFPMKRSKISEQLRRAENDEKSTAQTRTNTVRKEISPTQPTKEAVKAGMPRYER